VPDGGVVGAGAATGNDGATGHRAATDDGGAVVGGAGGGPGNVGRTTLRRQRPPREPVRMVVRGLGQVLITAGVVVLLFVVYELWVTNIFGEHKQAAATEALNELWAQQSDTVVAPDDPVVVTKPGGEVVT